MAPKKKYFGTDGIRGRVGDSCINPEFVLKLGWAAGVVLGRQGEGQVLIGKDTRISGYMLESVLEAGLSAAGIDIQLLGPMPTPGIAYLTRTFRALSGIVISASHNPYYDNGIKFFSLQGSKISDELELAIEAEMAKPMVTVDSSQLGKVSRVDDAVGRYIEFCKSTFVTGGTLSGMKIVIDCGHGATYHVAPHVFRELGAEVIELGTDPDGLNINDQCGSTKPAMLQKIVCAEEADLGIAFDGDGDRVIMVDHRGEIVDGDELLFIMAKHPRSDIGPYAGIVGTVMSNLGFEQAIRAMGIGFVRTSVGDRYVLERLKKEKWLLGGEASGHIVNLALTTTGDGIVSALQVLSALCSTERSLNELKSGMQKHPHVLINVPVETMIDVDQDKKIQGAVKDAEHTLNKRGRVLIRASGTEPVVRVMVEGEDRNQVQSLAEQLASVVRS